MTSETDEKIRSIDKEIDVIKGMLKSVTAKQEVNVIQAREFIGSILETANKIYKEIDPTGNLFFDALFTKRTTVYSGSEGTEFYLSKLMSLLINLKHDFPIVIDSFREGELSTQKENIVLYIFNKFSNQVLLSATLKSQELGKYDRINWINKLDYSVISPSKLLQPTYNEHFNSILSSFQK